MSKHFDNPNNDILIVSGSFNKKHFVKTLELPKTELKFLKEGMDLLKDALVKHLEELVETK